MPEQTIDEILDALESGRQRATYGAVAAAVGQSPRLLMKGRTRDQRHSWVVRSVTGLPTGYTPEQMHPELTVHSTVLSSREELVSWLISRQTAAAA
jgi:alkylated DNA nucleotide flippase Atl1